MNKEFIPYEQALALKELGFGEKCLGFYYTDNQINNKDGLYDVRKTFVIDAFQSMEGDSDSYFVNTEDRVDYIAAPLYQQAFRFFREKHGIMYIVYNNTENWKNTFHGAYSKINSDYESDYTDDYSTYEEAELACLNKLIEIVKNK